MIEITPTLTEDQRALAARIYFEAFRRKLAPLIGQPTLTLCVLTAGLNLKMMMGAQVDGKLLGLAGLHHYKDNYLKIIFKECTHRLGLVRGLYAWFVLNMFSADPALPRDHLRIAALAVDVEARGQGLGASLLEAIFNRARSEGFSAVQLEVVDTNTAARRLYERAGFKLIKTRSYPIPPQWLGFSADHVMLKPL